MSESSGSPQDYDQSQTYEICLKGHLDVSWSDWFGGLTISHEDNGNTRLTGHIADQAALHGLLAKIRDLGLPLISLMRVSRPHSKKEDTEKINHEHASAFYSDNSFSNRSSPDSSRSNSLYPDS